MNDAKILLANSVTEIVHGYEKTQLASNSSKLIVNNELTENESLPKTNLEINFLEKGIPLYKIFF